jgi:hypothetical protein
MEDLCWLANFCADHLPLVRFIFLNGIEESLTLFEHQRLDAMRCLVTYLVFCKFCIMHVLELVNI